MLRWPGSDALVINALVTILVAIIIIIKRNKKITSGTVVLSIITLLLVIGLVTKQSTLYQKANIDVSNPEFNHPDDYYQYAWLLYNEGDVEKAQSNLQHAIDELNNPNNEYIKLYPTYLNDKREMYERAMTRLKNHKWDALE